jgi:hypothetical protein
MDNSELRPSSQYIFLNVIETKQDVSGWDLLRTT